MPLGQWNGNGVILGDIYTTLYIVGFPVEGYNFVGRLPKNQWRPGKKSILGS